VPDQVESVKGLGKRAPLLAFAMTVFLFSMAGLPPFGGFASKFVLFSSAIDVGVTQDLGWLILLAVVAVVNSAISLFYYLRVIRAMYVEPGTETTPIEVGLGVKVSVGLCLAAVLLMGFWAQPFVEASMHAARSLLGLA
jgi:F420H2 dehydrogenase subunit N